MDRLDIAHDSLEHDALEREADTAK